MFTTIREASDAYFAHADDPSEEAQAQYEAAETYIRSTPPQTLEDAALILRCLIDMLGGGCPLEGQVLDQSRRIDDLLMARTG